MNHRQITFKATVKKNGDEVNTRMFETWWYSIDGKAYIPKDSHSQQSEELENIRVFIDDKEIKPKWYWRLWKHKDIRKEMK